MHQALLKVLALSHVVLWAGWGVVDHLYAPLFGFTPSAHMTSLQAQFSSSPNLREPIQVRDPALNISVCSSGAKYGGFFIAAPYCGS